MLTQLYFALANPMHFEDAVKQLEDNYGHGDEDYREKQHMETH